MTILPPALPGTRLRLLATSDLGAASVPLPTSSPGPARSG
jgi:hypothetical protein